MPISKIYRNTRTFLFSGTGPGLLLIACVLISLSVANSPLASGFETLLHKELGFQNAVIHLNYPLQIWVNDGLMAIFFLLVGLEIKRELLSGDLSSPKNAALPVFAALGGVLFPALIYHFLNAGTDTAGGWAIPMATDIAFALAIVGLLGKRVPTSLKVFLSALAIVDDLMAILVIAIFYAGDLHYDYLVYAVSVFAFMLLMNRFGVSHRWAYLIPGLFMWYLIHHSGIHATIAGVLTAFAIPARSSSTQPSPLEKLEHSLHKPVYLLIMPVFALANTNIRFEDGMLGGLLSPMGFGIILGLFCGKPIGIFLFSWISIRLRVASKPKMARWRHLLGVGMLAGIGFTMSIFIAVLSFSGKEGLLSEAKFSILTASVLSGLGGALLLNFIDKRSRQ